MKRLSEILEERIGDEPLNMDISEFIDALQLDIDDIEEEHVEDQLLNDPPHFEIKS